MSRKWTRMVGKNQKVINSKRKKEGLTPLGTSVKEKPVTYKGRYWILPLFLIVMTVFNMYITASAGVIEKSTWILMVVYILLALLLLVINRPTLSISKNTLVSRRFTGFHTVAAYEIQEIRLGKSGIMVQLKDKKKRWAFTKLIHVFPVAQASEKLKDFAAKNSVPLVQE